MAGDNSGSSGAAPKAGRNPIERLLVWGIIGLLLLVVANEAWSRHAYNHAQEILSKKMAMVDENVDAQPVTEADIKEAVWGKKPTSTEDLSGKMVSNGASRCEEYSWFTIHPTKKFVLYVYYAGAKDGKPAEVLAVTSEKEKLLEFRTLTKEEMEAAQKRAAAMQSQGGPDMSEMMRRGPGGRGGPPGRPAGASGDQPAGESSSSDQSTEKPSSDEPSEEKSESDQR
jgi:hypothetical protein